MRQFLLDSELAPLQKLSVTGKDFKYLSQVLRLREGDSFEGRLPSGKLCTLVVAASTKNQMVLQRSDENASGRKENISKICGSTIEGGMSASLVSQDEAACFLPDGTCCGYGAAIWLFQFMPKASKLDDIVRQCTEIGVEKIFLVAGHRSAVEAKNNSCLKVERWNRIIKEARQQSASPVETRLYEPAAIEDSLLKLKECIKQRQDISGKEASFLVMTEAPILKKGLHEFVHDKPSPVVIAVGSEGGISPEELEILKEFGFEPLHFSTNVLRSETAAVYGVSALQSIVTEFALWQCKE